PHTDSPGETRSRLLLLRAGFPEPVINFAVQETDTGTTRYLDLAYPELGIAVEYDGDYHRRDQAQWCADQARKDSLESLGWKLITWTAADIKSPQRALTALRRRFQAVGSSAPPVSNWSGSNGRRLGRSMRPPTRRWLAARCTHPGAMPGPGPGGKPVLHPGARPSSGPGGKVFLLQDSSGRAHESWSGKTALRDAP